MKINKIVVGITIILLLALPAAASEKIYGDANEDGVINMQDVTKIERIILGYDDPTDTADVNQDGVVNMQDVTYIELIILERMPHPGKTLRIALGSEPDNLNPFTIYSHSQSDLPKFFNGLVKNDENLELTSDLAESWDVSDNGKEYTFNLRQDIRWHDGEEFTAQDVKFTYDLIRSGELISMIPMSIEYEDIIEVEIVDDYTVKFKLSEGIVPFRERFTISIIPEHLLKNEDLTETDFWQNPIGTGPFKFKEWIVGDKLVMEANCDYFAGPPVISKVTFVFVPEETGRLSLLCDGEVDATKIDARTKETLTGEPGIKVITMPASNWYGITLPITKEPFTDKKVRQAIAYAINKQAMLDTIFCGEGELAYGPFRQSSWVYNPDIEYSYDTDRSIELLTEAGYSDTDNDGILEKDGTKLEFTLMYPVSNNERKDIALAVKTDLAEVGINVEPEGLTWAEIEANLHDDSYTMSWGSPYDPDVLNYKLFHSKFIYQGWYNPMGYDNPVVDELLDKGRTTMDRDERILIYQEFQEILVEDQPIAFFVFNDYIYALSDDITGIIPRPGPHGSGINGGLTGELWWNIEDWNIGQ